MYKDYKKDEIEYEDKIAPLYDKLYYSTFWEKVQIRDFFNFFKGQLQEGDKVLDFGCGPAILWDQFAKIKKVIFVGADISPKMIKEAKKKFPKGNFWILDGRKLPFKNEEFKVVICSSVLHHLPQTAIDPILAELRRVIKPYGLIVGREPQQDQYLSHQGWLTGSVMALVHMINRRLKIKAQVEPKIHQYHTSFKIDNLANLISKYFVIKKIESKYTFSEYLKKYNDRAIQMKLRDLDKTLKNYKGVQIFYLAQKDGYGKKEALEYVKKYLEDLRENENKPNLSFIRKLNKLIDEIDNKLPKEKI